MTGPAGPASRLTASAGENEGWHRRPPCARPDGPVGEEPVFLAEVGAPRYAGHGEHTEGVTG